MRYAFALIITVVYVNFLYGQAVPKYKGRISGKVSDSLTKAPVDFATISIYKAGTTAPFNGISTDARGNYSISNIPAGNYRVTLDFVGYKRKTIEPVIITDALPNVQLGNVFLTPSQTQLKTITVTGQPPVIENKIDKLVYNAENDLTAQGGVALDVLKKVPMVTVDIDGNVELQGNSSIRFLINGKPSTVFGASLADALQSIPASQIKNIEVITSPGAKYDAAGTGGIINIVLKSSKVQGFNGSINASAGTRLENGSLNLNARKGNLGINTYISGNEQLNTTGTTTTQRTSTDNTGLTNLLQTGSTNFKRNGYQTGASVNWAITKKDELTASISYNRSSNFNSGTTNQDQRKNSLTGSFLSDTMSLRDSYSNSHNYAVDMGVEYKKTFKKEGQELNIQLNSSQDHNNSDVFQQQYYVTTGKAPTGTTSTNPGKEGESYIAIDYIQPIADGFEIETGVKTSVETLSSTTVADTLLANGGYGLNANQSYGFNYRRNIYAAYVASTADLFNKFLQVKAGLRYERTNTTVDFAGANIPGYNIFAPSFMLLHKIDKTQSVKATYSFRIERPDYGEVNPFYNISDPHNISTGNPNLRPELGHNYELGYSKTFQNGGNIYAGAVYRYNTDDIQGYTTFYPVLNINGTDYSNVSLSQRTNIGSQTQLGVNMFGSVPVTGKLTLRSNIQAGDRSNSNPGNGTVRSFAYRANLNASYDITKDFVVEVFGNYNSSQKNIQGTRPAFGTYNIAMRKQFMNKKASIGLTAANPFSQYVSQATTTFGANFNQTSVREVPYRSFGISLSYKFGKLEFKKEKEDQPMQQALPDMGN